MKKLPFLILAALFSILVSCNNDESDSEKIVEMTIFPEIGYGASIMSDIWTQALIYSDSDDNQKQMMFDIIIEGIDINYERGHEYKLKAKKIRMSEPPQDVSSIKYILTEIVSKTKTITQTTEEEVELYVAPQTVKFMPKFPTEYNEDESPKIYNALKTKEENSNEWIILTDIEGFDFEEGFEYQLNVKKITQADPYSLKYALLDIVSKTTERQTH